MRIVIPAFFVLIGLASTAHAQVINGETPYDSSMLSASRSSASEEQRAERQAEADREARKLEDMLETSGSRPAALR